MMLVGFFCSYYRIILAWVTPPPRASIIPTSFLKRVFSYKHVNCQSRARERIGCSCGGRQSHDRDERGPSENFATMQSTTCLTEPTNVSQLKVVKIRGPPTQQSKKVYTTLVTTTNACVLSRLMCSCAEFMPYQTTPCPSTRSQKIKPDPISDRGMLKPIFRYICMPVCCFSHFEFGDPAPRDFSDINENISTMKVRLLHLICNNYI
jgi:hypothetical protein